MAQTMQYIGVVDGRIVASYGEAVPGTLAAEEIVNIETGRLRSRYGSTAEVVVVDDDRLLDIGDEVLVDEDGIATLIE